MKKTLFLSLFMLFTAISTKAQVIQFDTTDVQALRQIVFNSSSKGLSSTDEVLFRSMDKQISKKGAINLSVVPTNYLYEYAERLFWDYQMYKRSEQNARRFIKIMKKIAETDPNYTQISERSYQLINEIDKIKPDLK